MEINGGDIYDRIKEINPNAKLLLSSGYSIDGQATEILNRGCNGFIQKPLSVKELCSQGEKCNGIVSGSLISHTPPAASSKLSFFENYDLEYYRSPRFGATKYSSGGNGNR